MTNSEPVQRYRRLDPDEYSRLQGKRDLIKTKGSSRQHEFLSALKDNAEFIAFIENECSTIDGDKLPTFDGPLTEASLKDQPPDQEKRMYELWQYVPPGIACESSFWASVTLEHIREGKIAEATWLAANGNINESGAERIEYVLNKGNSESRNNAIDNCVRTTLRRMSGLPGARGNRSVFVDSTFGRAWWRERIVANILSRDDDVADRPALIEVVRRSQTYWENLVTMIVSRGSVFGSDDVQAALVNTLALRFQQNPTTPLRSAAKLEIARRRISNIAAAREIAALPFTDICDIIDNLLTRIESAQSNPSAN